MADDDALPFDAAALSQLVTRNPSAIVVGGPDGRFRYANPAACALLGYSLEELRGLTPDDITVVEDRPKHAENLTRLARGEIDTFRVEKRYLHRDGHQISADVQVTLIEGADGEPGGMLAVITDMTEQHAQREALEQSRAELEAALAAQSASEARLGRVIDGSADGQWEWADLSGDEMWWSPRFFELLGYAPGAFEPNLERFLDLLHPDDQPGMGAAAAHLAQTDAPFESEYRIRGADGRYRWFQAKGQVFRETKDGPAKMSGTVRDITEAKARETALARREQQLRTIADKLPGMVYQFEVSAEDAWSVPYLSDGVRDLFGVEPDLKAPPPDLLQLIHPDDQAKLVEAVVRSRAHLEPFDVDHRVTHPGGEVKWLRARATPFARPDGGVYWIGVTLDLSEQKRAEQALRESQERFQTLFERAPIAYQALDLKGRILEVNTTWRETFLYPREAVIGRSFSELLEAEDRAAFDERFHGNGGCGKSQSDAEFELRRGDGEVRVVRCTARVELVEDRIVQTHCVLEDITEQRAAEADRGRVEEQLRHAQKMEAIGTLAGGIAHDFNNILSGVLGYAELAREDATELPEISQSLDEIIKAALRARDVVQQVLAFSRHTPADRRPVRMQAIVKEVAKLMQSSLPSSIQVEARVDDDSPPVLANPSQLHQVLMNLCTNAYQAMQPGPEGPAQADLPPHDGQLTLSMETRSIGDDEARRIARLSPGRYVELRVRDSGPGIAPEALQRIFEPYYTTRARALGGTGLGLATVQTIVRGHGGHVFATSEPQQGAVFTVLLPAHTEAPAARPAPAAPPARADGQRILLVDDEPQIRDVVARALVRFGFEVEAFPDGPSALAWFEEDPSRVDVLVTDLTMPKMSGTELAQRVHTLRDDLAIVLCSGFGDSMTRDRALELGVRAFLAKPISASELSRHILEVLARPAR